MPARDIIVSGASSGGIEALQTLVRSFPANLPAAVFIVVHLAPGSRSFLPDILTAAGPLPAAHAVEGAAIQRGHIYIAPPDRHLIVEPGHMHLGFGPREQHQRPSINVTFRSAALAYGDRVTGVVLTGQLDDGTAGLWEIKQRGGITVVQNPEEAASPSMPLSALRDIEVDYTVRLGDMARLFVQLASEGLPGVPFVVEAATKEAEQARVSEFTCPECRGSLREASRGNELEFRCPAGHAYSARTMLARHFVAQERAMWAAVVAMEEGAALGRRLESKVEPELRERLREESRQREERVAALRQVLNERPSLELE